MLNVKAFFKITKCYIKNYEIYSNPVGFQGIYLY